MSRKVHLWSEFEKALDRLRRKYPHIDDDLKQTFSTGPSKVDALPGYSHRLWKARMPSRDMGHGKRGGFRVIFYLDPGRDQNTIYLISIYANSLSLAFWLNVWPSSP